MALLANQNSPLILPEGVTADIIRVNGNDAIHGLTLSDKLYTIIEREAGTHNAFFKGSNFNRVLDAVKANKIQAYFIIVGWDACQPRFAGGAIEFPTVLTEWDDNDFIHYPAVHGEDTFVSPDLSAEFRERTKTDSNPNGIGLGTFFMQERIRMSLSPEGGNAPFGMTARGRIAEYSLHSIPMIKLLSNLRASLGSATEGTIMLLDARSPLIRESRNMSVCVEGFSSQSDVEDNPTYQPSIFRAHWASPDRKQRICATFSDTLSTFTGEPIVRVQFTSNGNLPEIDDLQKVLSNIILSGSNRIKILRSNNFIQSLDDANDEPLTMHIHAHQNPRIAFALRRLGAKIRELGDYPMYPVVTNFKNIPVDMLGVKVREARPLAVLSPSETLMTQKL